MKKLFALMLSLTLCLALSACTSSSTVDTAGSGTGEVFQVGGCPIVVTTPNGWKQESDMENFDLQCSSPKQDMYLSVFGFSAIDLSAEQRAQDLFVYQTDVILSARENVTETLPVSMTEDDNKIVYSVRYSAERDGIKFYYHIFFVHFTSTDDMAWILFSGTPSVVEKNREAIEEIVANIQNSETEKEVKP